MIKINKDRLLVFIIVFITIFGNILKLGGAEVIGVTLTLYRVLIPMIFLILFLKRKVKSFNVCKEYSTYMIFMCVWFACGVIGLLLSSDIIISEAIKDFEALTLGFMVVSSLQMIEYNEKVQDIFCGLRICIYVLIIMGIIEIVYGIHLPTSMFSNETLMRSINIKGASGIFYNINDYCAFICMFLPLLYSDITVGNKIKIRLFRISMFIIALFIMLYDDANICIVASILSFIIYTCVFKGLFQRRKLIVLFSSFPAIIICALFVIKHLIQILNRQIHNYMNSCGSMYLRITGYKKALASLPKTFFMGVGPGNYPNYFSEVLKTEGLINPHNFWLEILTEYGLILFTLVVLFGIILIIRCIRISKKKNCDDAVVAVVMCISFTIGCLAPSSFLRYSYYWLILGVIFSVLKKNKNIFTRRCGCES